MDASALLKSQGWRGKGHSLHPTNDSTGLTHHILIKRNDDGRGLGAKKDHKVEAWWLNAFDQALKGIDTKSGTMKQTLQDGSLQKITKRSAADKYTGPRGLYAYFVKGGTLQGSLDKPEEGEGRKRKRRKEDKDHAAVIKEGLITPPDSGDGTPAAEDREANKESKGERRARRAEKKARKEEKERTRELKEKKREAKAKLKAAEEEAASRLAAEEQSRNEKAKRRKDRKERKSSKELKRAVKEGAKDEETREERRTRRDERRKRKEDKRRLRAVGG